MRFDGMIFDIEGTLIDCIPQNLRSWQETLSGFGLTVPLDVLQLYSGHGRGRHAADYCARYR